MTFRIGLVSDIHAYPAPLKEALSIFNQQKVDIIICAGDIGGYGEDIEETIALLSNSRCISILGNHEVWCLEESQSSPDKVTSYYQSLPPYLDLTIEGKTIYVVHASPPNSYMDGIRLLDLHGETIAEQKQAWTIKLQDFKHDILVVGHTHQVFAEKLADTLVINPGSTTYNHSCAILSLPSMAVDFYPLSGRNIKRSWNWGMQLGD